MKPQRYQAIFLDLFGTVVNFDWTGFPRVSRTVAGREEALPSTGGLLFDQVRRDCPGLDREHFLGVFFALQKKHRRAWDEGVTEEITCALKMRELIDTLGLGWNEPDCQNRISRLVEMHMGQIVSATVIPPRRKEAILALARVVPVALVSNFDHGDSGRAILERHGLASAFRSVVISDDLGKRKPHRAIFEKAAADLKVPPADTLMVGDSPLADVDGAARLGMDTAWIKQPEPWPAEFPRATFDLDDLAELPARLQIG